MIYGDDAHVLADDDGQALVEKMMKARYAVKIRARLGFEEKDDKECTLRNRKVRINVLEDCTELEADPRHAQEIIKQMSLEGGKSVTTPIQKEGKETAKLDLPVLDKERCKIFRSACMKACYLSFDRYDIQYTVKECAREMHMPTERGWSGLKRLARYFIGKPRLIIKFERQRLPKHLCSPTVISQDVSEQERAQVPPVACWDSIA